MVSRGKLVRKQFLVSEDNMAKMEKIAADQGTSVAEVVRRAIEAYDTEYSEEIATTDFMDLVSRKLKEVIARTQHANQKVEKVLKLVEAGQG